MVESTVRTIALVTSAIVLASFLFFATDQFAGASEKQQAELRGTADATLPHPKAEPQPRRFIDGAARELLKPFASLVTSANPWGQRVLPTLVALLVYGFGLGFLARSAKGLP